MSENEMILLRIGKVRSDLPEGGQTDKSLARLAYYMDPESWHEPTAEDETPGKMFLGTSQILAASLRGATSMPEAEDIWASYFDQNGRVIKHQPGKPKQPASVPEGIEDLLKQIA